MSLDNIVNYLTLEGYKFTGINNKEEYFYAKTQEDFDLTNLNIYNNIFLPKFDILLYDLFVIFTEISKYGNLLTIDFEIEKCNYIGQDYISIVCNNMNEKVNIKTYFKPYLKNMTESKIQEFANAINKKEDYVISNFDYDMCDDVVFTQINILINNNFKGLIKSNIKKKIFFLNEGYVVKYNKKHLIKKYFDLNCFSDTKKQEIIDVLNSWYEDLTIIKSPINNIISFQINKKEFIKNVWHKYEQKYYPVINDNIKL